MICEGGKHQHFYIKAPTCAACSGAIQDQLFLPCKASVFLPGTRFCSDFANKTIRRICIKISWMFCCWFLFVWVFLGEGKGGVWLAYLFQHNAHSWCLPPCRTAGATCEKQTDTFKGKKATGFTKEWVTDCTHFGFPKSKEKERNPNYGGLTSANPIRSCL